MLDTTALYQLEVKLPSVDGVSQTQVISLKGLDQLWFSNRDGFPKTGNDLMLYVATDEGIIYIWYNNAYYALDGEAADILDRLEQLEINKVNYGLYEEHTHRVDIEGSLNEAVISKITYVNGNINEVVSVGAMPTLKTTYNEEEQIATIVWTPGVLPTIASRKVITEIEYETITPTFSGSGVTSAPNVDLLGTTWTFKDVPPFNSPIGGEGFGVYVDFTIKDVDEYTGTALIFQHVNNIVSIRYTLSTKTTIFPYDNSGWNSDYSENYRTITFTGGDTTNSALIEAMLDNATLVSRGLN